MAKRNFESLNCPFCGGTVEITIKKTLGQIIKYYVCTYYDCNAIITFQRTVGNEADKKFRRRVKAK